MRAHISLYVLTILIIALSVWAYFTPIDITVRARGIVRPSGDVARIVAEVPGRISQFTAVEGATIQHGDVLLTLDDAQFRIKRAALLSHIHYAELRLSDVDSRLEFLDSLSAAALRLETATRSSALDDARVRFDRARQLFDVGLLSRASLEEARTAFDRAETDVSTLDLKKAEAEARRRDVAAERTPLLAAIVAAYKDLEQIQLELNRLTITSPVSGRIASVAPLHPGEVLASGSAIATVLADSDPLVVESWIASADRVDINLGQPVRLRLGDAYADGTIASIAPDVRVHDGLAAYRVVISSRATLQPGAAFDVHIITRHDRLLSLFFHRVRRGFQEAF